MYRLRIENTSDRPGENYWVNGVFLEPGATRLLVGGERIKIITARNSSYDIEPSIPESDPDIAEASLVALSARIALLESGLIARVKALEEQWDE